MWGSNLAIATACRTNRSMGDWLSGWTIVALGIAQVALPFMARDRPLFRNHYGIGLA